MIYHSIIKKCIAWQRAAISYVGFPKVMGAGGYALLVIPVATFCLGTWQVKRRAWKLQLIDDLKEKMSKPPIELPDDLNDLSHLEYRKVRVRGRFDHTKEVYIGPRNLVSEDVQSKNGLLSRNTQSGNFVITPFILADRDLSILINRGWVSRQKTVPQRRQEGQVGDEIELTGVVRLTEKRPPFCPKNKQNANLFLFRNLQAMSQKCDAAPVLLDADFESTVPGGPIGGQTRVQMRNEHFSYIITWYSLSAATSWLWYKKYFPKVL